MTHKSLKTVKSHLRSFDHAELRALLMFIEALLKSSSRKARSHSRTRSSGHGKKSKGRHLRPGVHRVKVGKTMRKIRVLSSGQWRFLKG